MIIGAVFASQHALGNKMSGNGPAQTEHWLDNALDTYEVSMTQVYWNVLEGSSQPVSWFYLNLDEIITLLEIRLKDT